MDAFVTLTVVASETEAEMVVGLLASDAIEGTWRVTNAGAGALAQTGIGGPVEVLVRPADEERARALLAAAEQG